MRNFFDYPITLFKNSIENLGKFYILIFSAIKSIKLWRSNLSNILNQMMIIGIKSMPIVIFTSLFSGMVTGVQAVDQFQTETEALDITTGSSIEFLGAVIGNSIVLELGPMITALIMTGKIL